jgi:hypothetical protein
LVIVNRAAISLGVQGSPLYIDSPSFGYMPKSGLSGSWGRLQCTPSTTVKWW